MDLREWQNKGNYFQFQGNSIFYRAEGHGENILFLHGFPTSSWDWYRLWPLLLKNRRLVALDFLGFGFSDKPRNIKYTIKMQADLVERIVEHLKLKEVHIVAHDYGDTVVQELLYRSQINPDYSKVKIKSVCLLNGGIFPDVIKPLRIQKLLSSKIGFIISAITNEFIIKKRFSSIFGLQNKPSKREWAEFWKVINFNDGKNISYKLSDYMNQRIKFQKEWTDALINTKIPLKLIIGTEDPISGTAIAESFEKMVPNPNVNLIENSGHYPQVETPEKVIQLYQEFLKKNI